MLGLGLLPLLQLAAHELFGLQVRAGLALALKPTLALLLLWAAFAGLAALNTEAAHPVLARLVAEVAAVVLLDDHAVEHGVDPVEDRSRRPEVGGQLLAVGAEIARAAGLPCLVSLENRMACGFGICLGCAVPRSDEGYHLVCRDGPVFESGELSWEGLP